MKKFISTILTIITVLGFTISLAGCKDKDKLELPEMTAKESFYKRISYDGEYDYGITSSSKLIDFLNTEFRETHNENYYLLSFNREDLNFCGGIAKCFEGENDEYREILYLNEQFHYRINDTSETNSIDFFDFISAPLEHKIEGELSFEYGEWYHPCFPCYFADVYIGDTCIGTCFFEVYSTKKVTNVWFKTFFTENLIYWEGP